MSPPPRGGRRRRHDELEEIIHRAQRRRLRVQARRRRRVALIAVLLVLVPVAIVAAGFGGAAAFEARCTLDDLRPVSNEANSFVYAANGTLLGSIPAERNRQPVALYRISPWMRKATVAIEDHRFYKHGGVDYQGIVRAAIKDLRAGRVVQGGSTITQQLVRNLYISKQRTFKRKLNEACLAIKLARHRSKNWILAAYMNAVYYGNHSYGVEAAAQTYFSRHAKTLTLEQAALLAGLPQAPSVYDPLNRPLDALERRDQVLRAMYDNEAISRRQFRAAVADRRLHLVRGRLYTRIREPYFFSYVRDQLIAEYGANTVRTGGLKVYTTINPRYQRAAHQAIVDTLYSKYDPASAIVSINPANGAIRAMTAVTPGKKGNQFNLVAQAKRQAGSTFKTFVLAAAVQAGINPQRTYYVSAPFHYQPPNPYAKPWDVSTYDHTYLGSTSIQNATLQSDNTVYAQLTLDVGPKKVAEMA
ncbi:MAG TPA: transglycosylase domain-containing protein, partial [Gaiellaceae bacterium]